MWTPRTARSVGAIRRAAVLAAVTALLSAGVVAAAGPAAATTAPVEVDYQNPVTALPPIERPPTPSCTVTAMRHDFANSYGQPFTGTLAPPADCPGPWSKVVLDWSGSVAGRQYDRLAGVWIGGAEVFRTSTPEPDPAGISWHVDQDISAFIPLLRTPQPVVVDLGNIVNGTYTGVYHMTMTVTYYQADKKHPEAAHSDVVVPVSQGTNAAGWFYLTNGQTAATSVTVPRNTVSAHLQVYARGGGCEEFWYSNVPDGYHPEYGLCGGGTYREVEVLVDGRPAGTAQPFPAIYTGGVVPQLWRPIPGIDAFRTQPYDLDLTPFAGVLADGRPHTVTLVPPAGISDGWLLDGSLFVDVDAASARTSGAVTEDTVTAPDVTTTVTAQGTGTDLITATADRDWAVSGYVDTSHGRVTTRVVRHSEYWNSDTVSEAGNKQTVSQRDHGWTEVTTTRGPGLGNRTVRRDSWSYPLDMTSEFVPGATGADYTLTGEVDVARHLTATEEHGAAVKPLTSVDDEVTAQAVLQRSGGVTVQADGTTSERYVGVDGRDCYGHYLAAAHGYVTVDARIGCQL